MSRILSPLTSSQIGCLLALLSLEEATAKQVQGESGVDAASFLPRLCKLGIVSKRQLSASEFAVSGRQPYRYSLTARGLQLAAHLHSARLVLLEIQQRGAGTAQAGDAACHPTN